MAFSDFKTINAKKKCECDVFHWLHTVSADVSHWLNRNDFLQANHLYNISNPAERTEGATASTKQTKSHKVGSGP